MGMGRNARIMVSRTRPPRMAGIEGAQGNDKYYAFPGSVLAQGLRRNCREGPECVAGVSNGEPIAPETNQCLCASGSTSVLVMTAGVPRRGPFGRDRTECVGRRPRLAERAARPEVHGRKACRARRADCVLHGPLTFGRPFARTIDAVLRGSSTMDGSFGV